MYRYELTSRLAAGRVVAILRGLEAETVGNVAAALMRGGVRALEVTMDSPMALEGLAAAVAASRSFPGPVSVGAGTVLDAETARLAILHGAAFLVSPVLVPDVIRVAHRYGVAAVPAAFTPTELLAAVESGADLVKWFPAGALGPGTLREILAPLRQVPVLATGGVNAVNAKAFLDAGAVAVGLGNALTPRDSIQARDWAGIEAAAAALLSAVLSPPAAG